MGERVGSGVALVHLQLAVVCVGGCVGVCVRGGRPVAARREQSAHCCAEQRDPGSVVASGIRYVHICVLCDPAVCECVAQREMRLY